MALIRSFTRKSMNRNSLHDEIDATYSVFETDGRVFVQIDSYGKADRQIPGKKSQSVQLDKIGALALYKILKVSSRSTNRRQSWDCALHLATVGNRQESSNLTPPQP